MKVPAEKTIIFKAEEAQSVSVLLIPDLRGCVWLILWQQGLVVDDNKSVYLLLVVNALGIFTR